MQMPPQQMVVPAMTNAPPPDQPSLCLLIFSVLCCFCPIGLISVCFYSHAKNAAAMDENNIITIFHIIKHNYCRVLLVIEIWVI